MNQKTKTIIIVVALIFAMTASILFSFAASKPEFHQSTIAVLDEKKADALALSASATAVAVGVSAFEMGEPIAELLTEVASYTVLITTVLFLEKFLLTTIGAISFAFIIPVACLIGIVYQFIKKEFLRNLAVKLTIFSLVMVFVIPVSTKISVYIEETHEIRPVSVEENQTDDFLEDKSFWDKFKDKTNELTAWAETKINNFIDSIAVMLITTCAIPIGVLAFMLWIIKIIFGVNISMPEPKKYADKLIKRKKQEELPAE